MILVGQHFKIWVSSIFAIFCHFQCRCKIYFLVLSWTQILSKEKYKCSENDTFEEWSWCLTLYASRFFFSPSNSPVMFTPRSTLLFSEKFFSYKFRLVYFFSLSKNITLFINGQCRLSIFLDVLFVGINNIRSNGFRWDFHCEELSWTFKKKLDNRLKQHVKVDCYQPMCFKISAIPENRI